MKKVKKKNIDSLKPKKTKSFLEEKVEALENTVYGYHIRFLAIEEFLEKNLEKFTNKAHVLRMNVMQDSLEGFTPKEVIATGDRVRIQYYIYEDTGDDENTPTDVGNLRRTLIECVGSGSTLNVELESQILGMKVGEGKLIKFTNTNESPDIPLVLDFIVCTIASNVTPKEEV